MSDQQWMREYTKFVQSDAEPVPEGLNQKTQARMQALLNPSSFSVFGKLLAMHAIVSVMSLSVCHQFGLNPFGTSFSLDAWFMEVGGHSFCMLACGFFFVSVSFIVARLFLTVEELRTLKRNGMLQTALLGIGSLTLMSHYGAEFVFSMALLWLLGAMGAGLLSTQVGFKLHQARV